MAQPSKPLSAVRLRWNHRMAAGVGVSMLASVPLFVGLFVYSHQWRFLFTAAMEVWVGIPYAAGRRGPKSSAGA